MCTVEAYTPPRDDLLLRLPRRLRGQRHRPRRGPAARPADVPADVHGGVRVRPGGRGARPRHQSLGLKPQPERLFARIVLGSDLDDWRPPPSYDPDALRAVGPRLETDPEETVELYVLRLRLSRVNSHRQVVLRGDPGWPGNVFRMLGEVLDKEAVPPTGYRITLATFQFEFRPAGGRRGGAVMFDVAFPNSCSLRNRAGPGGGDRQVPDAVGIPLGGSAGPGLAAAG